MTPETKTNFQVASFDQIPKQKPPQKKQDAVNRHSSIHRFMHFSFAMVLAVITIAFSIFFSENSETQASENQMTAEIEGRAFVTDEFGESREIVSGSKVFTGEKIETVKRSNATITLFDKSEVRLAEESIIKIKNKNEIELLKGHAWVFAHNEKQLNMSKISFLLENASGDFVRKEKTFEVTSWRHNIETVMHFPDGESKNFIIPIGSRVIMSDALIQPQIKKLRFSKLKKEVKMHNAELTDWEKTNIEKDKTSLFHIGEDYFIDIQSDESFSSNLLGLRQFLAVLPEKRQEVKKDNMETRKDDFFTYLQSQDMDMAKKILLNSRFSYDELLDLWQTTYYLSSDISYLRAHHEIEYLLLEEAQNDPEVTIAILRSSLSLMEDFIKQRNNELFIAEANYFRTLWSDFEYADLNSELSNHREVLFKIAQFYSDNITPTLLTTNEWINDLALANEDQENQALLKMEIAQKSLDLTDSLLNNKRYDLAKQAIDSSQVRFELETVPEMFGVKEKIMEQSDIINKKLAYLENNTSFNEGDFEKHLEDMEKAEQLLEELYKIEKGEDQSESAEEKRTKLLASVRDEFAKEDITIISHDLQGDSENIFIIHRAILPNSHSLSGTYNKGNKSISGITFDNGVEYPGGVSLTQVTWLVDKLAETPGKEDNKNKNEDGSTMHASANEEEASKEVSSTLASLLKKVAKKKLDNSGITVETRDILPISSNKVRIKNATIENYPEEITFIFNVDELVCTNIKIEDFELPDSDFEDLVKAAKQALSDREDIRNLQKAIEEDFGKLKFTYDIKKNIALDTKTNTARFSRISYENHKGIFVLSGIYDIDAKTFLTIAEEKKQLKPLNGVEMDDFSKEIFEAYIEPEKNEEEASTLSLNENKDAQEVSRNIEEEKKALIELKKIFGLYECNHTRASFSISSVNKTITFGNVDLKRYGIKIAGKYDYKSDIFLKITSSVFGVREHITFDQLDGELFAKYGN